VHTRKGVQLNTRIPIHGTADAAYTEALIGAQKDDVREMPITFPDNFEKQAVRGQQGAVKVTINEVLRVAAPPLDDELAKGMEFESLDQLRQDLRQRIGDEKQRLGKQQQEDRLLQALADKSPIPLPPSMVEDQKRSSLAAFAQRMQEQGMAQEEVEKKLEEASGEAQQDAERRVRMFFLIEAVAKQHKMFVTESDIETELRNIAAANSGPEQQITAAQVRAHLEQENRLGELRLALMERKVRDFLRTSAKTVDKSSS
jgi:trigger factor